MIGFCLSWGLTYAWTAKKIITHQFKKNDNNKLQHKREKKERSLALLSLSLGSPSLFCLLRVRLEGPKEPWTEELTGTWEKEDSTLVFTRVLIAKGCPTSFPLESTNCFWDFPVFLFFVSGPIPFALPSTSTSFNFSYLIALSLLIPIEVPALMASTAPFLIGTPVEAPTIRSHPDQTSGKSYA